MPSAQQWAGAAKGLEDIGTYRRERPMRDARLAEAKSKQQLARSQLDEYTANAPNRKTASEIELEKMQQELRKSRSDNLRTSTYDAFRLYDSDGDVRHLNTFLQRAKQQPNNIWSHWNSFNAVTRNPQTEALLGQAGINDVDGFFSDPDLVNSKVLGTDMEGKVSMLDMDNLYVGTGYTNYMTKENLDVMQSRATLQKTLTGYQSADTSIIASIADQDGISTFEAAKRYYEIKSAGKVTGSKVERVADTIMQENPGMSRLAAIEQATKTTEQRTAGMKDVDASDAIRAELDEAGFFEADLSDPKNRRTFGPKISAIEKLADTKMSTEDKRVVRQFRSLSALGGSAGEKITDEEAGLLDRVIIDTKQYITNNVEGMDGTAAYETFRNVLRNSLYGASLTASEMSAFNKAAGNLKQQAGPVLQKLLVQVEDVRSQLKSVYDMNDEYVATYYMGKSLEEIDEVIEALDQRVDFFKSLTKEATTKVPAAAPQKKKRSLGDIFQ